MKKLLLPLGASLALITSASAQDFIVGVGYANVNIDDGAEVDLGVVYGSIGYELRTSPSYSLIPEIRFGAGVTDDELAGFDISADTYISILLNSRFQFDRFYINTNINFTRVDGEASGFGFTEELEGEFEFGAGVGIGINISREVDLEAHVEFFDDELVYGAALKYHF